MKDIELLTQTADFIVKYGFLAVGLVLIVIVAPVIFKFSGAKRIALATLCFGLAFVVAYGVLSILTVVAPSWISAKRVMLSGIVRNVPNGKSIQIQSDLWRMGHAYAKREHDTQAENFFNFPFILVTAQAPSCLDIGLVSTDPNSDNSALFKFSPVSESDMQADMQIVADVGGEPDAYSLSVWREKGDKKIGQVVTLKPLGSTEVGCSQARKTGGAWSLFGQAFAQAAVSGNDLMAKLQSDDVFTRRDARIALSKKTDDDLKLLALLLARDDNYRLQLGAVVALADLPDEVRKKAPSGLFDKVRSLRNSSDKTMRDSAVLALREPTYCYQEIDTNKSPSQRYLALCHWTKDQCERTRGPNTRAGVTQSACSSVRLADASWKYATGGIAGAWYQFSPTTFGPPFPAVQSR